MAIYLIIYPMCFALLHICLLIASKYFKTFSDTTEIITSTLLTIVFVLFISVLLLWIFWLRATTLSVGPSKLNIPVKWFHWAFAISLAYLLINLITYFEDSIPLALNSAMRVLREIINTIGLVICYPLICHYSARAVYAHEKNERTTFSNSLIYTLLLIFIPICIPFLHKFVNPVKTENSTFIKIYAIAFGIMILTGLLAMITAMTSII